MDSVAHGLVRRKGPPPKINVGKHKPHGGSGSSNHSLFEHLHVPHANGRDITDPLCRYLSNDYEILKGICKAPAARIFDLTMNLYYSDAGA